MAYDDIFLSAINKAHDLKRPVTPKKAASPMQSQTSNAMADMVASHVVGMLVEKINEKTPPQELKATLSIEHDAKHWESLINKLKEIVLTPQNIHVAPAVNIESADNTALVDAVQNLSKLVRSLNQKRCITLNVLRDEDGKMAQIVIEKE